RKVTQTTLPIHGFAGMMALAAAPDGAIGVAWTEEHRHVQVLRAAVRAPDGRLGAPATLARAGDEYHPGGIQSAAAACAPSGRLLVAFSRPWMHELNFSRVSAVTPGGRPQVLGPALDASNLAVAVARDGRAIVAWGSQDGGEERNLPFRVYAAIR